METDLSPLVSVVPSMGAHPHTDTTPRARAALRLSSSDGSTLKTLLKPLPTLSHARHHSTDAVLMRSKTPFDTASDIIRKQPPAKFLASQKGERVSALPSLAPVQKDTVEPSDARSEQSNEDECASDVTEDDSDLDEAQSSTESLVPPSSAGFEPKSESSPQPPCLQFPDAVDLRSPFPATIIQDHAQLDADKYAATANGVGLSPRANNVVRGFLIHGPLDRQLLGKAIEQVANLHPILSSTFHRWKERLYVQTSQGRMSVTMETPIVGHEEAQELITTARRKLFVLTMRSDMGLEDGDLKKKLSVVSLNGSEEGTLPSIVTGVPRPSTSKKKTVTFFEPDSTLPSPGNAPFPPIPSSSTSSTTNPAASDPLPLIRARLVPKSSQEHILVLLFPQVVCDYWSSCLFVQQLADCYAKMEQSRSYRPSMAALKADTKRQAMVATFEQERGRVLPLSKPPRTAPQSSLATSRLVHKKLTGPVDTDSTGYVPPFPANLQFHQVAHRESQLLKIMSKEKLWSFWQSMATATIQRQRGPPRVKVIPPVRLPSGLGLRTVRKAPPSALRPLTARSRPQTARRGALNGANFEVLNGPQTQFHFIKVVSGLWSSINKGLPESYLGSIGNDNLLNLLCLAVYVVLLGRCCRGWGCSQDTGLEGASKHRDGASNPLGETSEPLSLSNPAEGAVGQASAGVGNNGVQPGGKRTAMRGQLDLGTFLVGVDVSLRDLFPDLTVGLFGPLTNNVGLRVNLSSSETFADLVVALGKTLQSARNHSHFPFSTIAEEVGLIRGLPVRFTYLRQQDIIQLTSPSNFYFAETAVGVEGHGLARLGTGCYLTPLNSKMDDSCHMELVLWESEGGNVAGGFRFQLQAIQPDLVKLFAEEYTRLLDLMAVQPCTPLEDLASLVRPPFLSSSKTRSRNLR
eukprot:Em0016g193a